MSLLFLPWLPFDERVAWLEADETGSGNVIKQILLILTTVITSFKIGLSKQEIGRANIIFVLFLIYILFSCFNSSTPQISLRRFVLVLIVIYQAWLWTVELNEKFPKYVGNYLVGVTLISLFLSLIIKGSWHLPSDPEPSTVGSLRGLFYHKNNFGAFAGLSTLYSFSVFLSKKCIKNTIIFSLCLLSLFLTKSMTSIGFTFLFLLLLINLFFLSQSKKQFFFEKNKSYFIFLTLIILLTTILYHAIVVDPFAFTGRGFIWRLALAYSESKIWLGHGFSSSFGVGGNSGLAGHFFMEDAWLVNVASAHNGYISLFISTGIIGVILIMLLILQTIKHFRKIEISPSTSFLYSSFFYCLYSNILESSLFDRNKIISNALIFIIVFANYKWSLTREDQRIYDK